MYTVYILQCADNTLYTGITNNPEKRIKAHNSSVTGAKYTRSRRPVKMVYSEMVENRSQAQKREAVIKRLKREEKLKLCTTLQ